MDGPGRDGVALYWLPLGAGGHVVRRCGMLYEALAAFAVRRERCDLYHSALIVRLGGRSHVIEQTPVPRGPSAARGVVGEGPVGLRFAGRLRVFRYEVRCWRDGVIPDADAAVDSPRQLSTDPRVALRVLELAATVPTPVWGRDELRTGEMWNSNSIIAWLLQAAGFDAAGVAPPPGGRAPGWRAGVAVASRTRGPDDRPRC